MNDLDISFIPEQFIKLSWLSKISIKYNRLIISKKQKHIFSSLFGGNWKFYREHPILIKENI